MTFLSISIPTYNRSEKVRARLEELIPQLQENVAVYIFDNASTDGTCEMVSALNHPKIQLRPSTYNRGISSNIARAMEEPDSEWIWLLGDDDPVSPDAVAGIIAEISSTSAQVIQFSSTGQQITARTEIHDLHELYEKHDAIRTSFISALAIHKSALLDIYSMLSLSIFTFAPHTFLIMRMLEQKKGALLLSPHSPLLPWFGSKRWSTLEVALGMSLMPDFLVSPAFRKIAAAHSKMDCCWKLSFGLREISDEKSAFRWKSAVRRVYAVQHSYGASRLLLGSKYRSPSRGEIKDFVIVNICYFLPVSILKWAGRRLRTKYSETLTSVDKEI